MDETVLNFAILLVFATATALVANARGRTPIGWFFIGFFFGCFALILVLVLPDLKAQEARELQLRNENRRLRERVKKDRMVADQRHQQLSERIDVHDVALGVSTGNEELAPPQRRPQLRGEADPRTQSWYYGDGEESVGPLSFEELRELRRDGVILNATEVWTEGMSDWLPLSSVPRLRELLDE